MVIKKNKKKKEIIIDGVDTSSLTREQLEALAIRLREQVDYERQERQYFQLERDKIRSFWNITQNELATLKAHLKNKDYEIEKSCNDADQKILEEGQRIKHLMYEHQVALTNLKASHLKELETLQIEDEEKGKQLIQDKIELKTQLKEQELTYENRIKDLKLSLNKQVGEDRAKFEILAKELQFKYEKELHETKEQLNLVKMMEISETEERNHSQIQSLTDEHTKAFAEMKLFFNEITLNNLAVIKGVKDQLLEQKQRNDRIKAENVKLLSTKDNLEKLLLSRNTELSEQTRRLNQYEKDNFSLTNTISSLQNFEKKYSHLQWMYDALNLRFEKLLEIKNNLEHGFEGTLFEIQAKSELKIQKLQNKLTENEKGKCL